MRFLFLLVFAIPAFFSCNNDGRQSGNDPGQDKDTLSLEEAILPEGGPIWIADYDTVKHDFFLRKQTEVNTDTLKAVNIVNGINAAWENIPLVFRKISNDTLYVSIPDSEFLTQRMGTSGASMYLAATTYNLTEIKGVKFVSYDFKEGDHASPGVLSREDFKDYR